MIYEYFQVTVYFALAGGLLALALGVFGRLPSLVSLVPLLLTIVGLIVQGVMTAVMLAQGAAHKGDPIEFYGYLLTAIIVGAGASFWALVERSKFSTMILGGANLTISVMIYRMWQIWHG